MEHESTTGIEVRVYGDSIGEMESAAMEKAEQFFGTGDPLRVVEGYTAHECTPLLGQPTYDGRYYADIRVIPAG